MVGGISVRGTPINCDHVVAHVANIHTPKNATWQDILIGRGSNAHRYYRALIKGQGCDKYV